MVDRTHLSRRASGIERVTRQLFSDEALAPFDVGSIEASGRPSIVLRQMVHAPAQALWRQDAVWIFPGYPPSPLFTLMRERTVYYVHDLFLITRQDMLNRSARLYMVRNFALAVKRLRYFMVPSETTGEQLAQYVRPDAEIMPYRPPIENVFGLSPKVRPHDADSRRPLVVGTLGTVEPRKNFIAAARICEALSQRLDRPVELHIIGRKGWGPDFAALSDMAHVRLHGFMPDDAARRTIETFDLFLSTSHDEGLGLPLVEVQFAGIPVAAPDQQVFREVLGSSGTFINPADPVGAADILAGLLGGDGWQVRTREAAQANIARWNGQAERDRDAATAFLARLSSRLAGRGGRAPPTLAEPAARSAE